MAWHDNAPAFKTRRHPGDRFIHHNQKEYKRSPNQPTQSPTHWSPQQTRGVILDPAELAAILDAHSREH